jgi:hypothetical protein
MSRRVSEIYFFKVTVSVSFEGDFTLEYRSKCEFFYFYVC